jgi:hypothetical protein
MARDQDGLHDVKSDAGIATAVYVNADAVRSGIVIANLTDEAAVARFGVAAEFGRARARVFPQDGATIDLARPVELPLEPHQVRLLAVDAALAR